MRFNQLILASALVALTYSCKDTTTKPPEITGEVQLTAETTAPSFVRLKVDISWSGKYDAYAIQRDGNVVFTDSISKGAGGQASDVYYDGGLLPNTTYEYRARLLNANKTVYTGKAITAATTDTTTHDITWQVDTIGVFPSILRDVAAINENNVWAVGDVEIDKTLGTQANVVIWNGTGYEYKNVLFKPFDGQPGYQEISTILAFSESDIWLFSSFGSYAHWDGTEFETEFITARTGMMKAAWGTAPDNFFIVGDNGSITHYDGSGFTLMNSGTDVDLFDIDGIVDPNSGQVRAWALGSDNTKSEVLYYNENNWTSVWDVQNPILPDNFIAPRAIYAPDEKSVILSVRNFNKGRIYSFDQLNFNNNVLLTEHIGFAHGMTGSDYNDILIAGSFTSLEHFNGNSTKLYDEFYGGDWLFGVSIKQNHYFAAGVSGQVGIFIRGNH